VDGGTARADIEVPAMASLHRRASFCPATMNAPAVESGTAPSGRAVFAGATRGLLNEGLSLFPGLLDERLSLFLDLLGEELSLLLGLLGKRLSLLKDLVNERLGIVELLIHQALDLLR